MTIKSFFSESVAEAIRRARQEMGDEAMLLKCRRAPKEWSDLGAYEVVFSSGLDATKSFSAPDEREERSSDGVFKRPGHTQILAEIEGRLIELGFESQISQDLLEYLHSGLLGASRSSGSPQPRPDDLLIDALREIIGVAPGTDWEDQAAAALVGPSGVGKTLMIVRLAISEGLALGRDVMIVAAPDRRFGSGERLRWFCSMLDLDFREPRDLDEFTSLLDRRPASGLVLIDTPGLGLQDFARDRPLVDLLGAHPAIRKHLVLSATATVEQLGAVSKRFAPFCPSRLIYTRLDEAERLGPALSHAAISAIPISYWGTGQEVPGDVLVAHNLNFGALLGLNPAEAALSAA